jgi:hypothetical protein
MVRQWQVSGHTVLPINWVEPEDPNAKLEIWLADPSRRPLWDTPANYDDDRWKILIDRNDGSWTFRDSYNSSEPRWLFWVPYDIVKDQPRTPSWETLIAFGVALGTAGTVVLILGDADAHQITDASGRTLNKPGLGRPGQTPLDLQTGPNAIPNMSPIPFFGAEPEEGEVEHQMFLALGAHEALSHDVIGRSDNGMYHWAMRTPGNAAILTAPASLISDRITAEHLGSAKRGVNYERPKTGKPKTIKLMMEGMPKERMPREFMTRQFLIDELTTIGGQKISARLDDGAAELHIRTEKAPATFKLRMRGEPGTPLSQPRTLTLGAGQTARLRPADWTVGGLSSGPVHVEIRDTPDGPPVECFDLLGNGPIES